MPARRGRRRAGSYPTSGQTAESGGVSAPEYSRFDPMDVLSGGTTEGGGGGMGGINIVNQAIATAMSESGAGSLYGGGMMPMVMMPMMPMAPSKK